MMLQRKRIAKFKKTWTKNNWVYSNEYPWALMGSLDKKDPIKTLHLLHYIVTKKTLTTKQKKRREKIVREENQ